MMVVLTHEILTIQSERGFSDGLIWFRMWEVGSPELVKPGWKIIEGMQRTQGDLRSLDIAPAQVFREDERVELHAFLIQMMAFGWSGHYVPSAEDFFLDFRTSEKFFCVAKSEERLKTLYSSLTISEINVEERSRETEKRPLSESVPSRVER